MKKFTISILTLICILAFFSACSAQTTTQTREVEAVVVKCEKGIFMPDEEYLAEANICLAFKKLEAYAYFKKLADENGAYQYNVTVELDGEEYTISRMETFEPGTIITVSATFTYSGENLVYVKCE